MKKKCRFRKKHKGIQDPISIYREALSICLFAADHFMLDNAIPSYSHAFSHQYPATDWLVIKLFSCIL